MSISTYAKRLGIAGMITGVLLVGIMIAPARAAESVTIDAQTVNCDSITLTYTVVGAAAQDYALLYAHRQDDTQIAFNSGPGTDGQHTVVIPLVPAEPAGTVLYGRVSVGSGEIDRIEVSGTPTPCGGGAPPVTEDGDAPPAPWPGFSDGRLNPALDEYYSVWCHYDRIDIYRSIPQQELLKIVSLAEVIALHDGGVLDLGDFMTLVRTGDTITIYGSNGNRAPEPGSKAFRLSNCVEANGGAPEPPDPPPDTNPPPQDDVDVADPRRTAEDTIAFCIDAQAFFDFDPELFIDCLAYAVQQEGASTLEILWVWIFQTCMGLPLASVPLAMVVARRRR